MSERENIEREEFLDKQDPLRHFRSSDPDGVLVPPQPPSILNERTDLLIPGISPGDPGITVKLALDASPGCGGIAWPAGEASHLSSRRVREKSYRSGRSQILSSYLLQRGPSSLKDKTVLELGSGTGLVGLVAGYLGPEHVWITDQRSVHILSTSYLFTFISEVARVIVTLTAYWTALLYLYLVRS